MSDSDISSVRAHLMSTIGDDQPSTASVTFLGLEPLDVLRFGPDDGGLVRYVTLGCSRHPMADPGELVADPNRGPRAELILVLDVGVGNAIGAGAEVVDSLKRHLAVLAASPSVEGVVLVEDALLDLGEPLWMNAPFTAVLLGPSEIPDLPLPEPKDPVHFLSAVPITGTEAAWVRLRGADALRAAWTEAGIDIRNPRRTAASL